MARPTAIDLFCGVGGMGLGFEQAGFDVLAAFDLEAFNIATHQKNFPSTFSSATDLSKISGDELLLNSGIRHGSVDVVFGGPPCQGFSFGGQRIQSDERNLLIFDFARLIRQIQPKYFVMENVQGLLSSYSKSTLDSFLLRIKRSGYTVVSPIRVLNAQDFGVPQRRNRTIIIGCRQGTALPEYPEPIGCLYKNGGHFTPFVRDAISDLPNIDQFQECFEVDTFRGALPKSNNRYAMLMRGKVKCPTDLSSPRISIYGELTGCLLTRHSIDVRRRFCRTKPGFAEPISRYIRLDWNNVSPTLRAGTGAERGSHTAPRPIHPDKPRCITTREAARLHSFPDWFQFYGTRWHGFRQIGNSVPPMLARAVARKIAEAIGF